MYDGFKMWRSAKWFLGIMLLALRLQAGESVTNQAYGVYGPLLSRFPLTLNEGERMEVMGPLFYSERLETQKTWAFPPLYCHVADPEIDAEEQDFLYPLLTYDRFGHEYRWQLFQLLSFSGGHDQVETNAQRFTLFPFYFQQRSGDTNLNYTALVPFYGHLQKRLFKDEITFIMFPAYAKTRKRDVVTKNYVYPFVHTREGAGLKGWQFWPFYGTEEKTVTYKTNNFGDAEMVAGHKKTFAPWLLNMRQTTGIGTTNEERQVAMLPLFSTTRSPARDSTTVVWPFFTWTDDRAKKYKEYDFPYPLIVFANGEGKTTKRVFPFFSQAHTPTAESDFYLWPVYKYNRLHSGPLDRERTRILLFLYSDVNEKNLATGGLQTRNAFWPFYTHRRDFNGNTRLQVFAPLEPLLPHSKSIDRNWSPVWSVWRDEKNPKTGARSQSLLWNLYRSDRTPTSKKNSLLFGLFQYQSEAETKRWRLFYLPVKTQKNPDHVSEYR